MFPFKDSNKGTLCIVYQLGEFAFNFTNCLVFIVMLMLIGDRVEVRVGVGEDNVGGVKQWCRRVFYSLLCIRFGCTFLLDRQRARIGGVDRKEVSLTLFCVSIWVSLSAG